jgi:hypothetical protein
LIIKGVPI